MSEKVSIDIWSDVQCPWCYIGKRRLETALDMVAANTEAGQTPVDVDITYHSFELSPDTPVDFVGTTVDYLMDRKGLSETQVHEMFDQVTGIAAEEGLEYHLAEAKQVNTRKVHELLHYAREKGLQLEAKEALFHAYFTESRNLGEIDELVAIGQSVGLDPVETEKILAEGTYVAAVDLDEKQAREMGINGVPFFVLDGKYGISGAQPAEVLAQAIEQVAKES